MTITSCRYKRVNAKTSCRYKVVTDKKVVDIK